MKATLRKFETLLLKIPALLRNLREEDFSHKPSALKWSKKEILGHLIDSASNNLQRFIRGQFEETPNIRYAQDEWVKHNHYSVQPSEEVIEHWESMNRQILWVLKNIPNENLLRTCSSGEETPMTLEWLAGDYVAHQEYHLSQIVGEIPGLTDLEGNRYRK